MKPDSHINIDLLLERDFDKAPEPDFGGWEAKHGSALEYLNPVVTALHRKSIRRRARLVSIAVAASLLLAAGYFYNTSSRSAFAQTIEQFENSQTMTWMTTTFMRRTSKDTGKSWLVKQRVEYAYSAPDLLRATTYGDDGKIKIIEIHNATRRTTLAINFDNKSAGWREKPSFNISLPPFAHVSQMLKTESVEHVGERIMDGSIVNVVRIMAPKNPGSEEYWIDSKTKQLVQVGYPSSDLFDPATDVDRNELPEAGKSTMVIVGSVWDSIVFSPALPEKFFAMEIPAGFDVQEEDPRPDVTERELVDFLRAFVNANGLQFADSRQSIEGTQLYNSIVKKPTVERSELERQFYKLWYGHFVAGNSQLVSRFIELHAAPGSFRYLGKGVRLGEANRLLLYYKTTSGQYRAVFGDLAVRDISHAELPLPID